MRIQSAVAVVMLAGAMPVMAQVPTTSPLQNATSQAAQAIPLDRVVAIVGDVIITQSGLQERVIEKRQGGITPPSDSAGLAKFLRGIVNELIDEELLLQKAKELKVEVPESDVKATVDKQYAAVRKNFNSETEFRNELAKAGYGSPDEYKRFISDQIKRNETITRTIRKLKEDGKISQANVTDADIADAYQRAKGTLPKREAAVAWRQIIVAPKPSAANKEIARQKAESLLAQIKSGADFELLAKRESMDPGSKENGGDLGWNRRGRMLPEFDRWMFALPPGQLSPVVETAYGYHIIRVDRVNPAEVKARHILISPKIDSADVARAKLEADSIAAALKLGQSFDSLAKKHNDFRAGEETTLLTPIPRANLPEAYQQGFSGKVAKDITVFPIPGNANVPTKYVVAQIAAVEEGGDMTLQEVKEKFRQRLAEEGGVRRLLDSLRKGTYVTIREDALAVTNAPPSPPATAP